MEHNETDIKNHLQRIANILLINGGFLDNPGLYTGEMGLFLFFARYADLTKNKLYLDYAYDLVEKIQNKIHTKTPIDFKQGLTGIGSAIEYLEQEGYIDVDTDDVLEGLDERIFSVKNLPHLTVSEILDTGYYALWRISGNSAKKGVIIESFLPQLIHTMAKRSNNNKPVQLMVDLFKDILNPESIFVMSKYTEDIPSAKRRLYWHNRLDMLNQKTYNCLLEQMIVDGFSLNNNIPFGIENGLAGLGLSLISELDNENYWTSLVPNILSLQL